MFRGLTGASAAGGSVLDLALAGSAACHTGWEEP
jgi:hypothetical protein